MFVFDLKSCKVVQNLLGHTVHDFLAFGDILRVLSLKLVGTPGTFKLLVIVKLILGVVLFLTGEVIYAWSSGQLRQEKELALANFKNQLMEASTNDSTDP